MKCLIQSSESGTWQASQEEKAATWNFVVLDKNKNKVLERKEWKAFRSLVSSTKQLRRCGKKLPRYCDVNNDRRISIAEWLECLNTKRESKYSLLIELSVLIKVYHSCTWSLDTIFIIFYQY